MPHKHTFRASKGNGGFTHAQRPGHKGDSGFSLATHCTKKASNAASEVWTRHLCGDDGSRPGSKTTRQSATRPHWCGGRRRDRRARAGFETRRRAKRSRLVSRAAGPSGAQNTRGATSNTRRKNDAPSEARSADGERAGRRPPAHTAAGPSSARNTSSAQTELLAREAVDLVHDEAAHGAHPRDGCDAEDAGTPGPHLQEVLETVAGSW